MNKVICLLIGCLVLLCGSEVIAERHCLLNSTAPLNFSPREVMVVIQARDEVSSLRGTLIPTSGKSWMFGALFPVNKLPLVVKAGFLILGERDELLSIPPQEFSLTDDADRCLTSEHLKTRIQEIGENLRKEKKATAEMESQLKRIRGDVDLIADIGEIVAVKEDRLNAEMQLEALARDKDALEKAFRLVRNLSNPKNFPRREAELLTQIPALAEVAAQAERSEQLRQQQVKGGLQQHLDRIKAAAGLDLNQLQEKLLGLRNYRADLEEERGIQ